MLIKMIDIDSIEVKNRLRPVTLSAVKGLAEDIAQRGLRQPIEVAAQSGGNKYRLVAGAHRLEACKSAGLTEIAAVVIVGPAAALRRHEILENITRNDLSKLERAQFLAELKRLYQVENPHARHGGDRTNEQDATVGNLNDWYAEVATRSERAGRTIQREASIGEHLTAAAAAALRGSDFEDNQKELYALSRLPFEKQDAVAQRLTAPEGAARTVAQAVKIIDGHVDRAAAGDPSEKALNKLKETWSRADAKARRLFVEHLIDEGSLSADCTKGVK
ncbi:ParB/RepB/Spo0J family partition protein [Varunaivibrio sulfuroxidans]|uniref:ParB family chromosome partitioning protein n=1 Tax=Varunaivibrio sulfuroxidans TaxID=1773489 RepID=A0A4R3JB93_9PROT|nr:ParB/RepB/Spo0J family partition protein [Varunaivibrio sulfuroxidans]TCS62555.1 ParB family chromosome partitioning protein [Varunaivibrio sulfuroxidans]WES30775.1 ParB/RepB/Spo0J family partition protein [Varunaivibrio sulfuroxidans]